MSQHRSPKPWPMKWVVVAILVCIAVYTFLTLRYRKPGPAFAPYADLRDRANTLRLLSSGFQRIALDAARPVDATVVLGTVATSETSGGLPDALRSTLVDTPHLAAEIGDVAASPNAIVGAAYPVRFSCRLADDRQQLGTAFMYARGTEIFLVPDFEKLPAELQARSRETTIVLTIPSNVLKFGNHHVTLLGAHSSRTWVVQVH